jgi:hypothetical protein
MIDSNIVILKLRGVCRTKSSDPSRGLEVIWGMSNTVVSKLWVFAIPNRATLRAV